MTHTKSPFTLSCDDGEQETILASSVASAEDAADEWVLSWAERPDARRGTTWYHVHITDPGGDRVGDAMVAVDPIPPACANGRDEHDWQSPHQLVGGIKENPGVWGHGGGVLITEACLGCGCARVTDTWAQCPATGRQGLRSVSYQVGRFEIADDENGLEGPGPQKSPSSGPE